MLRQWRGSTTEKEGMMRLDMSVSHLLAELEEEK